MDYIHYNPGTLRAQGIGLTAPLGRSFRMGYMIQIGVRTNPAAFREWILNRTGGSASLDPPYS